MIFNSLTSLLPKGSLYQNIGPIFIALLKAIAWQFEVLQTHYIDIHNEGNINKSTHLDGLTTDYNIVQDILTTSEMRHLLNYIQGSNGNLTKKKFMNDFISFFPQINITTPAQVLSYTPGQTGLFITGSSQTSGPVINTNTNQTDIVFVTGTLATYKQRRFLEWFLMRFDRAKHKHIFDVKVTQTNTSSQCGIMVAGIAKTGGYYGHI